MQFEAAELVDTVLSRVITRACTFQQHRGRFLPMSWCRPSPCRRRPCRTTAPVSTTMGEHSIPAFIALAVRKTSGTKDARRGVDAHDSHASPSVFSTRSGPSRGRADCRALEISSPAPIDVVHCATRSLRSTWRGRDHLVTHEPLLSTILGVAHAESTRTWTAYLWKFEMSLQVWAQADNTMPIGDFGNGIERRHAVVARHNETGVEWATLVCSLVLCRVAGRDPGHKSLPYA